MPEMIDGPRGTQHYPQRPASPDPFIADEPTPVDSDSFVVFHCASRNYRLQFTSKADIMVDGQVIKGEGLAIQAHEYVVRLNRNDEKDARIIERALKSPFCGVGREFWRPEDMKRAVMNKRVQDVRETLKDPQFLEALKAAAGSDDFAVANTILNALTEAQTQAGSTTTSDVDTKKKK